jgi:ATP-dependent exoDNAse (exonuclease V) beta subunit
MGGKPPVLLRSESERTEPHLIAELVSERLEQGISPEEIAILVQTNRELQPLARVLEARGISADITGSDDLLRSVSVQQLIAILRAIEKPERDHLLAAALGCACFDIHPADLGRMFVTARERRMSIQNLLLEIESWITGKRTKKKNKDLIESSGTIPPLKNAGKLLRAFVVLQDLHTKLPSRTVVYTLEHAMRQSGLLENPEMRELAALQEFFHRVEERASENPRYDVQALLQDLEVASSRDYPELRWRFDLPHLQPQGVKVMTVHQSKGKEFDVVLLANFREGHWDKRRKPPTIAMPEDLLFGWSKEQRMADRREDERRLTYVGMTRARTELLMTCPRTLLDDDRPRPTSPSAFFAQMGPLDESEGTLKSPEKTVTLGAPSLLKADEAFKAFLEERLETFALSPTALNRFLRDPQEFLAKDLLQVPEALEPNLVYGSAVHDALKEWALSIQRGKGLSSSEFLKGFRTYLDRRAILTPQERRNLLHTARESLPRYYSMRLLKSRPFIHKVEHTIIAWLPYSSGRTTLSPRPSPKGRGEIPLKGKIDRIDLASRDSARATIIDFKTGRPQTESEIRKGEYFRQLVFYALLLRHGRSLLKPEKFVLDFIGEKQQEPLERIFEISPKEERDLETVILAVWSKILALDFSPL